MLALLTDFGVFLNGAVQLWKSWRFRCLNSISMPPVPENLFKHNERWKLEKEKQVLIIFFFCSARFSGFLSRGQKKNQKKMSHFAIFTTVWSSISNSYTL